MLPPLATAGRGEAFALKRLGAAGVVAAGLAGWRCRGVSEPPEAQLLAKPRSPPILSSLEKGVRFWRFACLASLGPSPPGDPMSAEPLLQGVHGLLNHAGSREGALCYREGTEAQGGRAVWLDTPRMWAVLARASASLTLGRKIHTFKRRLFCPWP